MPAHGVNRVTRSLVQCGERRNKRKHKAGEAFASPGCLFTVVVRQGIPSILSLLLGGCPAIKKASGRCSSTNPTDTARYALPFVTRFAVFFVSALARLPPDGGLCLFYIRLEDRSIRQRIVSSAKTRRRLMRPTPLPVNGSMRRVSAWSEPRNAAALYNVGNEETRESIRPGKLLPSRPGCLP